MKWYIAGPMSGRAQFNIPGFLQGKEELIRKGFAEGEDSILCPHDLMTEEQRQLALASPNGLGTVEGEPYQVILANDLHAAAALPCTHILLLNEWWRSRGARVEAYFALSIGWRIYLSTRYKTISEVDGTYILDMLRANPPGTMEPPIPF